MWIREQLCFFIKNNYEVYGVDVAPSFISLVEKNLKSNGLNEALISNFRQKDPNTPKIDFPDSFFDFIVSNQVLYYMPNEDFLHKVCAEMLRVLKPGGYVFFTMMGMKNYYITHHSKRIINDRIYEVIIDDPNHRLFGVRELILIARDESDLCRLFKSFEPVSVGYFDQSMFDMYSNFHYIFVGRKQMADNEIFLAV